MVGTVNVDLTPVIRWLENGCAIGPAIEELKIYQARLAAAPKAEPFGFSVDDLAQEIRRVDGKHDLGAGALAEALMPFLCRAQPEAPKVEPVPVGKVVGADFNSMTTTVHWSAWPVTIGTSVYAHPAPASDELLEALEVEIERLRPHYTGHGIDQARIQMLDHFSDFIAKHKGPQS